MNPRRQIVPGWQPSSTIARAYMTTIRCRSGCGCCCCAFGYSGTRGSLHFIDDLIWQATFDGRFREHAYSLQVFGEHNQVVQATIPAERLLVFDILGRHGDGSPSASFSVSPSSRRAVPAPERYVVRAAGDPRSALGRGATGWRGCGKRDPGAAGAHLAGAPDPIPASDRSRRARPEPTHLL